MSTVEQKYITKYFITLDFRFGRRGPIFWSETVRCVYVCMCVCCSLHPAALKVEKVNGRLIRKLGSRHAGLPSHYSSLIGGPLPKGEHNMIGSLGYIWLGWSSWQEYVLHTKMRDYVVGLTCRSVELYLVKKKPNWGIANYLVDSGKTVRFHEKGHLKHQTCKYRIFWHSFNYVKI